MQGLCRLGFGSRALFCKLMQVKLVLAAQTLRIIFSRND